MKRQIIALMLAFLLLAMVGCKNEPKQNNSQGDVLSTPDISQENKDVKPNLPSSDDTSESDEGITTDKMIIQISDKENVITFQLNDSKAAKDLYKQLPLTLDVQNYGNNEKIFYPPEALDVSDTPKAGGEVGTLAYYAPWADVVMFFKSYSPNNSLYELGQVLSGSEQIQLLQGTITIEVAP